MTEDDQAINWLNKIHWNPITNHEPVGTRVYLLTETFKIIKGYRKEPTKTKHKPNTYYSVDGDKPLFGYNTPIMWTYP